MMNLKRNPRAKFPKQGIKQTKGASLSARPRTSRRMRSSVFTTRNFLWYNSCILIVDIREGIRWRMDSHDPGARGALKCHWNQLKLNMKTAMQISWFNKPHSLSDSITMIVFTLVLCFPLQLFKVLKHETKAGWISTSIYVLTTLKWYWLPAPQNKSFYSLVYNTTQVQWSVQEQQTDYIDQCFTIRTIYWNFIWDRSCVFSLSSQSKDINDVISRCGTAVYGFL